MNFLILIIIPNLIILTQLNDCPFNFKDAINCDKVIGQETKPGQFSKQRKSRQWKEDKTATFTYQEGDLEGLCLTESEILALFKSAISGLISVEKGDPDVSEPNRHSEVREVK